MTAAADPARTDETRAALVEAVHEAWGLYSDERGWIAGHFADKIADLLTPLVVGCGNQRAAEALKEAADEIRARFGWAGGCGKQLRNRAAALTAATRPSEETE